MPNTVNPAKVQKYLKGLEFPTDKQHIVEVARSNGADDSMITFLEKMPERNYGGPAGIAKELAGPGKKAK